MAVRQGRVVAVLVAVQWAIGLTSLLLLVPTTLLLTHLLVADLLWMAWTVYIVRILEDRTTERPRAEDRGT